MADISLKLTANAPGAFYVTEDCVDCDLCRNLVPNVFHRQESTGFSYVARQPANEAERQAAEEAVYCCPTEAIGGDGSL